MTLLDAPKFDEARDRRKRVMLIGTGGLLLVLFVAWWLLAGMPASNSAARMALTAAPSEPLAGTLNEIVLAGNWPMWLMRRGSGRSSIRAIRSLFVRPVTFPIFP